MKMEPLSFLSLKLIIICRLLKLIIIRITNSCVMYVLFLRYLKRSQQLTIL